MKTIITSIFTLVIFGLTHIVTAQDFQDCETSLKVCDNSPVTIGSAIGVGIEDDGVSDTCLGGEANSAWISWSIISGGVLTFNLVPTGEFDDLDFLVFKLNDENDCLNKEVIRCMASGGNVGQPASEFENCIGATGLLIGDTDTIEEVGCSTSDNNYLAPIETSPGEQYVLMVNNFSQSGLGFELSFGGDAVLGCTPVDTKDVSPSDNTHFDITPTVSSGEFQLNFNNNKSIGSRLLIHDMNGQQVFEIAKVQNASYDIDLSEWGSGIYLASLYMDKGVLNKKFVIAK